MSASTAERPTGVRAARKAKRATQAGASTDPSPTGAPSPKAQKAPKPPRRARVPRPPQEGAAAVVTTAFTMIALVSLWVAAQALLFSGVSHDRAQAVLYQEFRTQLADTTAPFGPVIPPGDPVAIISIPAIGVDEVVVEGTASGDTLAGPGHLRSSVLPGQLGSSYIYGRAGTYGAPFADITDLEPGDVINVTTAQGEKPLTVLGVRREGDPKPASPGADVARLTLVSVEGAGRLSALTADTTVFVDAEAADAYPAPSGRPTTVPDPEKILATDSGALPLLALCLALLLALTLGVVSARQRWSAPLIWVLASPLAIALAWMTTDTVMRLLPNVI